MKKFEKMLEKVTGREVDLKMEEGISPKLILLVLGLLIMVVYALGE